METPRPATLGEILDRTANIYRTRFLVFVGVALMPMGVILVGAVGSVLFFTLMGSAARSAEPATVGIVAVVFFLIGMLIFMPLCVGAMGLGAGALNHAAAAAFENQKITIRGAYKAAWKRGWHYIWLLVLEGLILLVAPGTVGTGLIFLFAMGTVMTGRSTAGWDAGAAAAVLGLFAMALYALCMLLMLCLSFPVCVVEKVGAWTAVKRSVSLSKGTRLRILVLYILGMLLRWGVSMVLIIPVILIVTLVPGLDTPQHSRILGSIMVVMIYGSGFLVRALTKPIYTIAQMLFYYDQRIRNEGFDIEWMMRQAGMVEAPAAVPESVPWMPPARVGASELPVSPQSAPGNVAISPNAGVAPPAPEAGGLEAAPTAHRQVLSANALPAPGEPA